MNDERNECLSEAELAEAMEVGEAVSEIMAEYGRMADAMGEEDASLWLAFSMMETNGHVDDELIDTLAGVWRATSKLTGLMARRYIQDKRNEEAAD